MKGFDWFRKRLAVRIAALVTAVILLLSAAYAWMQVGNAKISAYEAITSFGMRMADSFAGQFDAESYATFLADPQENDLYWSMRGDLDRFRAQIGALYVYTVRIDEEGRPLIMIDGQPQGSDVASPINEATEIPEDAIRALLEGKAANSPVIDDPQYGVYLSSYAPIKRADGAVIGVIGIDTEAAVLDSIAEGVIRDSLPLYAAMAGFALLGLALVVLALFRALRPLKRIAAGAEDIAAGEFGRANKRMLERPVRSRDEIGDLHRAVVAMSTSLHTVVGGIVANIARTSDQVAVSTDRLATEARDLLEMNAKVSEQSFSVAEGAEAQRVGSEESAKAMEEMTDVIQRVSESATAVSEMSMLALESAEAGRLTMQRMNGQMRAIAAATGEASERASALRGYSQEIGDALAAVSEIANRTRLLALNASIEAARAGEHGAGFAVVAGEVRKLAESASRSTAAIASLLQNVQGESQRIGEAMTLGAREVNVGETLSAEAERTLTFVVDRFRRVTGQLRDISAAAGQMSASAEEVSASVGSIAGIARTSADRTGLIRELTERQLGIIGHFADAAAELSGLTRLLQEAVKQVKV